MIYYGKCAFFYHLSSQPGRLPTLSKPAPKAGNQTCSDVLLACQAEYLGDGSLGGWSTSSARAKYF
jgi:hypothetical protein